MMYGKFSRCLMLLAVCGTGYVHGCSNSGSGPASSGGGGAGGSSGGVGGGGAAGGGGKGGTAGSGGAAGGAGGSGGTGGAGGTSSNKDADAKDTPPVADSSAPDAKSDTGNTDVAAAKAQAIAAIKPTTGNGVTGTATFTQETGKVVLVVELANCPVGKHAVHLQVNAACGNNGNDAGGHWDPGYTDMPEVDCKADGKGTMTVTKTIWTVGGAAASNILLHAVIVHGVGDTSRIGCGVPKD